MPQAEARWRKASGHLYMKQRAGCERMSMSTPVQYRSATQHDRHPDSELHDAVKTGEPPYECVLSRRLQLGEQRATYNRTTRF